MPSDRERLDWLEGRKTEHHPTWGGGEGFGCPSSWQDPSVSWSVSRGMKWGHYGMPPELTAMTLREAIDAAMMEDTPPNAKPQDAAHDAD